MAIPSGYELATDAQFREVSNFTTPPRAGRVTAIEGSGQVRVETDDPDGGDVLAWPLNGFTYAVNDVVYVVFAVNSPDSAIVIGSIAPLPTLDAGALAAAYVPVDGSSPLTGEWDIGEDMAIRLERLEARDGEGISIQDDGGNVAIFVEDGGFVGIRTASADADLHIHLDTNENIWFDDGASGGTPRIVATTDAGAAAPLTVHGTKINLIGNAGAAVGVNVVTPLADLHVNLATNRNVWIDDGYTGSAARILSVNDAGNAVAAMAIQTANLTVDATAVGIGAIASPQGKLHVHDGSGGQLFVSKTAIDGTAQTIIPDGSGDVVRGMFFLAIVQPSSGSVFMTSNAIANNSNTDIYSSGANVLNLHVNANGSVDVRRTGGTLTYTLSLFMIWL